MSVCGAGLLSAAGLLEQSEQSPVSVETGAQTKRDASLMSCDRLRPPQGLCSRQLTPAQQLCRVGACASSSE